MSVVGRRPRQSRRARVESESAAIAARLRHAIESSQLTRDGLWNIYSTKSQLFLSDNNRIWTTGAIIIPLAFGTVAALAAMKDVTSAQRLFAGLVGLALLLLWNLFADRHRTLQERSEAWLRAIESVNGGPFEDSGEGRPHWWNSIRTHRWLMAGLFALYPFVNLWVLVSTVP
jgi:hypothetical protein